MKIIILLLSIFSLIKTISYGMYELKTNKNKSGATAIICTALVSIILISTMLYTR